MSPYEKDAWKFIFCAVGMPGLIILGIIIIESFYI